MATDSEHPNTNFITELMVDSYGSPEGLARMLDLGIEMLFYVEADTFEREEVQNVVSALRDVIKALRR